MGLTWLNHCSEENDVDTWFAADPGEMNKGQERDH